MSHHTWFKPHFYNADFKKDPSFKTTEAHSFRMVLPGELGAQTHANDPNTGEAEAQRLLKAIYS